MTASVSSPEDVVNIALRRIGSKERVNNLLEGTEEAKIAVDIYAQTRDELLRAGDWDFAERTASLTLLKQAPDGGYIPGVSDWTSANPALPWRFQYLYPDDCLKLRSVKPAPIFIPNYDPQPNRFTIDNDPLLKVKVVLSDVPNAFATYAAQITDPTQWDADFVEALAAALAERMAKGLASPQIAQAEMMDEAQSAKVAQERQG